MAHRPQKKWGQNFLRNRGAADTIVAALAPEPQDLILEIGPGEGALTEKLAELPNPLIAWEIDPSLVPRLRERFDRGRVEIAETDATDAELPVVSYRAIGNLPYNVATPIVRRVVASEHWRRAVFMFQREVAEKLTAAPGDDEYGYLTLSVALRAQARILITLAPGSFHPRPKVHSAVVVLDPVSRDLLTSIEEVESLVSASFRMRRKTLVNNLLQWNDLGRDRITSTIEGIGLPADIRAERLGLQEFDRLALALRSI